MQVCFQQSPVAEAALFPLPSAAPKRPPSKSRGLLGCRRAPGVEYVLDYMVERKRCDDLVSSVRDQRYAAQKYRMRQSRLRNLFYLLEGDPDITCEPTVAFRRLRLQLQLQLQLQLLHIHVPAGICSRMGCWSSRTCHTGGVLTLLRSNMSRLLSAGMGPSCHLCAPCCGPALHPLGGQAGCCD